MTRVIKMFLASNLHDSVLSAALPGAIILGGVALLVFVLVLVAVRSIRMMLQRLSQSVPAMLMNELKKDLESGDYARRMQEPVSLSGMDRIYGPQIKADFPELNLDELKTRAERLARTTLLSIDAQDPSLLSESAELYGAHVRHYIENLQNLSQQERYSEITIHRSVISDYQKDAGTCRIRFQTAVGARFRKEEADGRIVSGQDGITQFKAELEALYVQDRDQLRSQSIEALAFNCPNCGAPVPALGDKTCDYCGAAIEPLNIRVWTFSGFTLSGYKGGAFMGLPIG